MTEERPAADNADFHNGLGNARKAAGDLAGAQSCYQRALELAPLHIPARYNLGLVLLDLDQPDLAEAQFQRIHELDPNDAEVLFQLALLRADRSQFAEAAQRYRSALKLTPDNPYIWFHLGRACRELPGQLAAAMESLQRCVALMPDFSDAHVLLGDVLMDHSRVDDAVREYREAIRLSPENARAHGNLGDAMLRKHRLNEAISAYCRAIELAPDLVYAHFNLGCAYGQVGAHEQALRCYETVVRLRPEDAGARGLLLFEKQRICDWSRFEELCERQRQSVVDRTDSEIHPFGLLSIPSTPAEQLQCARNYAAFRERATARDRARLRFRFERRPKNRPRIGYLSADFREHPVPRLIAELFELHDRDRFEIAGYSYGPDDGSRMRARLVESLDSFVDIGSMSHADAAARIHSDQVDILVDLTGYTAYNRAEITALRPAPIQVSFLGYPGTLGADFIDYVITDRFITAPGSEESLSEAPVYLPGSYQVNDRKRPVSGTPRRGELGLPEEAMVFCCFNHTFKILPDVYSVWMRLLQAVPHSVLWLLESNPAAAANLRREARNRGIGPERLVFAPHRPQEQHLGRMRVADLFLDTLPYNAHTTASDALWVGLPVLTCAGSTFASRVAGSLLTAVGMPELIAGSMEEYEAMAVRLAQRQGELADLREKLARNRPTAPLFDTPAFARNLETAYVRMWENYLSGDRPRAIAV